VRCLPRVHFKQKPLFKRHCSIEKHKKSLLIVTFFDGPPASTTTYLKGLYQELIQDQTKTFILQLLIVIYKPFLKYSNVHYLKYVSKMYFRLLIDIPRLIEKMRLTMPIFNTLYRQ
jgi:hypothetical protein